MSKGLVCVVDFTSIVYCDDDWSPNHIEHVGINTVISKIKTISDDPKAWGYLRVETFDNMHLMVNGGDWGPK